MTSLNGWNAGLKNKLLKQGHQTKDPIYVFLPIQVTNHNERYHIEVMLLNEVMCGHLYNSQEGDSGLVSLYTIRDFISDPVECRG